MPSAWVLFTISEHCLEPVLEHEYRQEEEGGFLCPQEALMLTSNPGQPHETMYVMCCNVQFSGAGSIHNNSLQKALPAPWSGKGVQVPRTSHFWRSPGNS